MGKGRNDYLRVGKVEKAEPKIGRNTETPTDGSEHGTKLAHINVFRITFPGKTNDIAPLPPVGGHTLARVRVGLAGRDHSADATSAVRLATIQMLNHTQLKRGLGRSWEGTGKLERLERREETMEGDAPR